MPYHAKRFMLVFVLYKYNMCCVRARVCDLPRIGSKRSDSWSERPGKLDDAAQVARCFPIGDHGPCIGQCGMRERHVVL